MQNQQINNQSGQSELRETLGAWLIGDAQATINKLANQRDRAEIGESLYKEMWDTSLTESAADQQRFLAQIESRDMVINMLQHSLYKLLYNQPTSEHEWSRVDATSGFIDELRQNAINDGRQTRLVSTAEIMDLVAQDIREEQEVIDLTDETDDEETEDEETEDMEL